MNGFHRLDVARPGDSPGLPDRLPPHNLDAEQGLIGCALLDNATISVARAIIHGHEDFWRTSHQMLWRVICDLSDRGEPVDGITLAEELSRRDWLEDIGGTDYVGDCVASVPHALNARAYSQIVRQKAAARDLIEGSTEVIRRAYESTHTAEQLVAIARRRVEEVEASAPTWDEPDLDGLPPATPFPLGVFPPPLAAMVAEAAETFPCPPDFMAIACLAVASIAIGRSVALAVKESWVESPGLYLAFCALPGSIKSQALKVAIRPIVDVQRDYLNLHLVEIEAAKEAKREAERLKRAGIKQDAPLPEPGRLRRVVVDDATTERLAELLGENPRGLLMAADELTGWIGGMNQYKSGGNDRQFYLSAWSGSPIIKDRKSQEDGIPIIVRHPLLSIVGALPPDQLGLLAGDGRDDGFLDRILFGYPDSVTVRFSARPLSSEHLRDWSDAVRRLLAREMIEDGQGGYRPYLTRLSERGLETFARWFDAHCEESEESDFPKYLRGPWAKMRGYCARFALVLDQLQWAYDPMGSDLPAPVGSAAVERAARLMTYFKDHARRVYHAIHGSNVEHPDARAILDWAGRREQPRFSERDARNCFRRRFAANPSKLTEALGWLEARGCLRKLAASPRPQGGRRASDCFEVHPSFLSGARKTVKTTSGQSSQ